MAEFEAEGESTLRVLSVCRLALDADEFSMLASFLVDLVKNRKCVGVDF